MLLEGTLYKIHFCFLYVLGYSGLRNVDWIAEPPEQAATVATYLAYGFFVWFFGVNLFLASRKNKRSWNKSDFLSPYVVFGAVAIVALLEFLVYR